MSKIRQIVAMAPRMARPRRQGGLSFKGKRDVGKCQSCSAAHNCKNIAGIGGGEHFRSWLVIESCVLNGEGIGELGLGYLYLPVVN